MTLSVSPQMRLVALLGGLAALGLAAFMLMPGRSSPGATQASLTPAERAAINTRSKHKPRATTAPNRVVTHWAAPKAKPKPALTKPARLAIAVLPGLPPDLASALRRHELVVVSLYDPAAQVDHISLAEASAGASVAHAGFVPLSVLDQRQAGPLMNQLGVLPDPAVLVYRRPGKLVARFDGFADRDTVAQAVTNAMPAELAAQAAAGATTPAPASALVTRRAWASRANKICSTAGTPARLGRNASRAAFVRAAPRILAAERAVIAELTALTLPTDSADRLLARSLIGAERRYYATETSLLTAMKRKDRVAVRRALPAEAAAIDQGDAAANGVGATACAVFGK